MKMKMKMKITVPARLKSEFFRSTVSEGFRGESSSKGKGGNVVAPHGDILRGGAVEREERGGVEVGGEAVGDLIFVGEVGNFAYLGERMRGGEMKSGEMEWRLRERRGK
jgi:hypothetical protein